MNDKIANGELHLESVQDFDCQVGRFLQITRNTWYDQYSEDDPRFGRKKSCFDNEDSFFCVFQFKNFRFRFTKKSNYDTMKFYLYESRSWGDEQKDLSPTDALQLCDLLSKTFKCYVKLKYFVRDLAQDLHETTCRFYKGNYIKPKTRPKMNPSTGLKDFLLEDGIPFHDAKVNYVLDKV